VVPHKDVKRPPPFEFGAVPPVHLFPQSAAGLRWPAARSFFRHADLLDDLDHNALAAKGAWQPIVVSSTFYDDWASAYGLRAASDYKGQPISFL